MSIDEIVKAMDEYPEAKGIFVNNPTYYGICSNLPKIVEIAHSRGMKVLVDEAHGAHFTFSDQLPNVQWQQELICPLPACIRPVVL